MLTGHRRAGKSCILELLSGDLSVDGHVIYIDMENPENADIKTFRELSEKIKAGVEEAPRATADATVKIFILPSMPSPFLPVIPAYAGIQGYISFRKYLKNGGKEQKIAI